MKTLLLIATLTLGFVSVSFAEPIGVGMSEAKLIELKGAPESKATLGKKAIYRWRDMHVTLIDGKVDQVQMRDAATERRNATERSAVKDKAAGKKNTVARDSSTKTIREVMSDMPSNTDKPFQLDGTIEISSSYNWGYRAAQGTHFAFQIQSGGASCYAYMKREKASDLREQLLSASGGLGGVFKVVVHGARGFQDVILCVELLDYRLQKK